MEISSYAGQLTASLHDKDIDPCKGAPLEMTMYKYKPSDRSVRG